MKGRGMPTWFALPMLLVCWSAIFLAACGDTILNVGAPSQVNNNIQTVSGPGGAADTGPASGPVSTVTINAFGEPLRKDLTGACARSQKEIAVGCQQAITCNPRDKDGNVIFNESVTGTTPERFELVPGSDTTVAAISTGGDSAYNLYVTGRKPGIQTFECRVKGVQGVATFAVVP